MFFFFLMTRRPQRSTQSSSSAASDVYKRQILRREGLYSSHITEWRKAAQAGAVSALGPKKKDRRDREIEQLRARAENAEAELERTKAVLDIVGKTHALLETLSESKGIQKPPQR